ncbi:LysR family transcriptional regulator [Roseibium alexandrii]|uniref:LysR family transcriptional regulator n=1 Tax=Roseibium alexandrii TaxID=388408 RepID=UPI0037518F99
MIDRRIKFRHIQCFVEIAQERSLKLAADKLNLTQPAISKTLKELEETIGATLMTRSRAGISLTQQGKMFLHFAQISLASLQQGLDGVVNAGEQARATLTVGALPSVSGSFLPAAIREFRDLAPTVMLKILDGPHGYLIERLRLGEIDLVIGRLGRPVTMEGVFFYAALFRACRVCCPG